MLGRKISRGPVPVITALVLALALGGCAPSIYTGGGANQGGLETQSSHPNDDQAQLKALDNYVAAAQHQIPALVAGYNGMYSDAAINAIHPGTVEYSYRFAKQADPVAAKSFFDSMVPKFQTACDTQLFPDMKRAGITTSQSVKYTYLNADGSEIWSHTFTPSG